MRYKGYMSHALGCAEGRQDAHDPSYHRSTLLFEVKLTAEAISSMVEHWSHPDMFIF
jgi:hypothetical protein